MENMEQQQAEWRSPFFTIWTGQQLSLVGSRLAQSALVWWLTKTTGSATVLATATMVAMLPGILSGPFVGVLVDRWNRRVIMILADSLMALAAALLAYFFWADAIRIWHVYLIMFFRAIGGAFHWPSMQASTSLMVPRKHLSRVAGLNQTMQGALNVVAPPMGALLLSLLPMHSIMAIDVFTAAFAITPLFFVYIPQPERNAIDATTYGSVGWFWRGVSDGLRYVYRWPGLLVVLLMASFSNFLAAPAFTLLPVLVVKHFDGGALQLGWMNSASGIGIVLGGLTLSIWGGFQRRIVTVLVGWFAMSIGVLMVGLAPATAFWLGLAGMFLWGIMNPVCNGAATALFQTIIAPEMQGRAFTMIGSLSSAMAPLGMAIAGPVADALGVRFWYLLAGMIPAVLAPCASLVPSIMHLEDAVNEVEQKGA